MNKKRNMYAVGLGLDLDKEEDLTLKNRLDALMKQEKRTVSYFVREGLILLINNSRWEKTTGKKTVLKECV